MNSNQQINMYKTLKEMGIQIVEGNSKINQRYLHTGDFPTITSSNVFHSNYQIEDTNIFVDKKTINYKKYAKKGDLLMISVACKQKNLGKVCLYTGDKKCLVGNGLFVLKHKHDPHYLFHAISSGIVKKQIANIRNKSVVSWIKINGVSEIKIPAPSLEKQKEISNILRKFTTINECLKKEIEDRKKQYEYYKEKIFKDLLNDSRTEMKTLEDLDIEVFSGDARISKKQNAKIGIPALSGISVFNGYRYIKSSDFFTQENQFCNRRFIEEGDIMMLNTRDMERKPAKICMYVGKEKCLAGGNLIVIKAKEFSKYLIHALSTEQFRESVSYVENKRSWNSYVNASQIKSIKIPIPAPEKQQQIAKNLQKFIEIIEELKVHLKKRQQQYEYYRDFILSSVANEE